MALTLDSPKLRDLTRTELQSLAKREVIRAVGKTEEIIRRLMHKHPKGVPVPEASDDLTASSAPQRNFFQNARGNTLSNSPVLDTPQARTDPKGKGKAIADPTSPSPSSSTEALQLLDPDAYDEAEDVHGAAPPNYGWRVEEEELDETCNHVKGAPNHYMVVDALRQFTTLTNTIPAMETRIAENRCLLRRTENLLDKATPEARKLAVTREYLETILLGRMKLKRELWDGTGRMEKPARKARMEWLRAQRKREAEKKYAEVNEFNRRNGHKQEPLSPFVFESDEEVIESLETTPTSSRGGSAKRAREESTDVAGIKKKRARS